MGRRPQMRVSVLSAAVPRIFVKLLLPSFLLFGPLTAHAISGVFENIWCATQEQAQALYLGSLSSTYVSRGSGVEGNIGYYALSHVSAPARTSWVVTNYPIPDCQPGEACDLPAGY